MPILRIRQDFFVFKWDREKSHALLMLKPLRALASMWLVSAHAPKSHRFDSWSRPYTWVSGSSPALVGAHVTSNQSMYLDWCFSLSLPYLAPFPLWKSMKRKKSSVRIKKKPSKNHLADKQSLIKLKMFYHLHKPTVSFLVYILE